MFGCGFLLLLFVWCCCCLGDVAGSSADASGHEAVLSGSHVLSVLHGPVACHVDTAQIQVVVEHSGVLPLSLALLSEQQLLQANWSSCFVSALVRTDVGTFVAPIGRGVYFVVALACQPVASSVQLSVFFYRTDVQDAVPSAKPVQVSQLSRQQWWITGIFVLQFLLACFAFYSFPRGWDQRLFWFPFPALVGWYLVLSLAEVSVHLEGDFVLLGPVRWLRFCRGIWRAVASLYFGWLCVGSYLLGTKAKAAVWLRWGVLVFGSFCILLPGCSVALEPWFLVSGYMLWAMCFWGTCLWLCLLNLRVNKLALDGHRPPNAASAHDELVKRFALRLLRGSCWFGLAGAFGAATFGAAGGGAAASAQLCDAVLLVAYFAVLLGMILNFNSTAFIGYGSPVELRRRFVGAIAGVMNGMRERARARQAQAEQRRQQRELDRQQRILDRQAAAVAAAAVNVVSASAPPQESSTDQELLGSTTDMEVDVTEPDATPLLPMTRKNGGNSNL